ncbi:MAG: hypothetical protein F6J87_26195 [Spirulina sp. SIO3F2]|nr:hypothetical protein [Spirulina sp. SIO3F2]
MKSSKDNQNHQFLNFQNSGESLIFGKNMQSKKHFHDSRYYKSRSSVPIWRPFVERIFQNIVNFDKLFQQLKNRDLPLLLKKDNQSLLNKKQPGISSLEALRGIREDLLGTKCNLSGSREIDRIDQACSDYLTDGLAAKIPRAKSRRIFIIGSLEQADLLEQFQVAMQKNASSANIIGYKVISANYDLNDQDIQEINALEPDLTFVALPKAQQELWLQKNKTKLNVAPIGLQYSLKSYIESLSGEHTP